MTREQSLFEAIPKVVREDCVYYLREHCGFLFSTKGTSTEIETPQYKLICANHGKMRLSAWGRKVALLEVQDMAKNGKIERRQK